MTPLEKKRRVIAIIGSLIFLGLMWGHPHLGDIVGAIKIELGIPSVPTSGWQCISWSKTPEACATFTNPEASSIDVISRNILRTLFSFTCAAVFVLMAKMRIEQPTT